MNILKLALLGSLRIAFFGFLKVALLAYTRFLSDTAFASAVPEGNGHVDIASYSSQGGNRHVGDTASFAAPEGNVHIHVP